MCRRLGFLAGIFGVVQNKTFEKCNIDTYADKNRICCRRK